MPIPRRSRLALLLLPAAALAAATACSVTGRSLAPAPPHYALADGATAERLSPEQNTEAYDRIYDNPFLAARDNPLSTFSIDVDTASYANVRRFLHEERLPPPDAVRIEELVNYFRYTYPAPEGTEPLAVTTEVGPCAWNPEHRLVRIGMRARAVAAGQAPARNLTFLIDVSGSMADARKLPLLKRSLALLADQLEERDRLAIVVYAGASGVVLPPTSGAARERIRDALAGLEAGGSTNGAAGIELAYQLAERSLVRGGVNRVILATDGDFNVGVSSQGDLLRLIEEKRKTGIALTVLGFGMGNLKDATMEKLADKGDGNYAYIDSLAEARKVLVEEAEGTLVTVASDVKIQVEMNPVEVESYRLIGYENRLLRKEEFDDDAADAGELGAGQTVTAFYEIAPARRAPAPAATSKLKYQDAAPLTGAAHAGELMTVKVRYKPVQSGGDRVGASPAPHASQQAASQLASWSVRDGRRTAVEGTSRDFRFASAVVAFGLSLRASPHRGQADYALAKRLAESALAPDADEHRRELVALVGAAQSLAAKR
jgi:Ca-activated chloride channel family protein